jgi:hypothetical protein
MRQRKWLMSGKQEGPWMDARLTMESREPNRATTPSFSQRKARSHHYILRASMCDLLGRVWQQKWLCGLYVSQPTAVKAGIFQLRNSALTIEDAQILQHTIAWAEIGGKVDSVAWPTRASVTSRLLEMPLKLRRKLPDDSPKTPKKGDKPITAAVKTREIHLSSLQCRADKEIVCVQLVSRLSS